MIVFSPRGASRDQFLFMVFVTMLVLVLVISLLYRLTLASYLRAAVSAQNPVAVTRLIRWRAPVNTPDENGFTPLALALGNGDFSAIGGDPTTHTPTVPSLSPLSEQIVVLLLKAGADPKGGADGKPYLLRALDDHSLLAVHTLLAHGADPNATYMQSPMIMQAVQDDVDLYRLGKEEKPVFTDALLAAGGDVRVHRPYPGDGFSGTLYEELPLIEAVRDLSNANAYGHEEDVGLIETLLAHGADVNGRNHDGRTALFIAANNGDPVMVQTLLAHGAAPNVADWQGHTPLQLAQQADANASTQTKAWGMRRRTKLAVATRHQNNTLIQGRATQLTAGMDTSTSPQYATVQKLLMRAESAVRR